MERMLPAAAKQPLLGSDFAREVEVTIRNGRKKS
jgi:hypothetical protein